ncbi:Rossmann-like alpha/beta/alpha sandwich fold protein [Metarhizium album ARSEF 1941]|uniref:FAD synthase n=1 Tax=Metarhizium album (strain ARSEF 1941) TaxID=1081103 RepID=A0A0B2WU93_METAS|nr:Rossmann-like alpha/beta/alpha sandwich fold protein [Metarhizium album ARSEF 1941]KHN97633.1 Rossmann-like alpha/beta/alpha sandwich fold protein [Metarhizium album ARSEF 1941]
MVFDSQSLEASQSPHHMTQNGHIVAPNAASAVPRALPDICYTLRRMVIAFLDQQPADSDVALKSTQKQARASIKTVEEALRRYQPDQISLSYNGGKDCLVLLVLILACLPARYDSSATTNGDGPVSKNPPPTMQAVYIAPLDPFPEVEEFVSRTTREYHLDLTRYVLPMQQALEAYQAEKPAVKAIFMGSRRTDPFCEFLSEFSPTDNGWPEFMRVNPILDWHYTDIWTVSYPSAVTTSPPKHKPDLLPINQFILRLEIPFCTLYQQGFSSLGGVKNTRPNPALAVNSEGTKFRPAYELTRDDEERLGRDK